MNKIIVLNFVSQQYTNVIKVISNAIINVTKKLTTTVFVMKIIHYPTIVYDCRY